jgi:hypothetical protein
VLSDVPHAFFPRRVEASGDTAAALRRILEADPLELAIVEGDQAPAAGAGIATISRYDPNEVVLQVDATRGGLLFISEVYYPAWRALVDGEATEVLRTNTAFRGVVVPEGSHEVILRYSASEFRVGFMVSGLAATGVVAWLLIGLVGGRVSRGAGPRAALEE